MSGDLADHGSAEEYVSFFAHVPSGAPTSLAAGNHGLSEPLFGALAAAGMSPRSNAVLRSIGIGLTGNICTCIAVLAAYVQQSVDFAAAVDLDDFLDSASTRPDAFRMASRLRLLQTTASPRRTSER